jgi:hypothetical protein
MTKTNYKLSSWLIIFAAIICAIIGIAQLPTPARALPPRPPTPTPLPTPGPTSAPTTSTGAPRGATISLQAHFPLSAFYQWGALWTVVEWQDPDGTWHEVEGWRGTPDEITLNDQDEVIIEKIWWVQKSDLGRGPFRWLVYVNEEGHLLTMSEMFHLPDVVGRTTIVEVR